MIMRSRLFEWQEASQMKEHDHTTKTEPDTKLGQDEVAKKAYAIYLEEGRPQGHAVQNWLDAETKLGADHKTPHAGPDHHAHIGNGFPETVLDLADPDPADPRPL